MKEERLGEWNDHRELKVRGTLHTLLYILNKGKKPLHSLALLKVVYFADRRHLAEYGVTISGDDYYAMEHGPVASSAYNIVNCVRHDEPWGRSKEFLPERFKPYLEVNEEDGKYGEYGVKIKARKECDRRSLPKSGLRFLDESLRKHGGSPAKKLSAISHDKAWKGAWEIAKRKGSSSHLMGNVNIAEVAGASKAMIEHIRDYYSRTSEGDEG